MRLDHRGIGTEFRATTRTVGLSRVHVTIATISACADH
jgi:hypothetical protein